MAYNLLLAETDAKQYTFILKDQLLSPDPETGREQSTISYEYDFQITTEKAKGNSASIFIAWKNLEATYRGKEMKDTPPLNYAKINRMNSMMRRWAASYQRKHDACKY